MNQFELFVPGRLCLFGEHSDWAGGHRRADASIVPGACLITGTDQGIYADVARCSDLFEISSVTPEGESMGVASIPWSTSELASAAMTGGFERYAAGVACEISSRWAIGGVRIAASRMDLPLKKGLSSSAAICVLTARAFNQVYDLALPIETEMELAYFGELRCGSMCGRMDQACAFGAVPTLLTCDADRMTVTPVRPRKTLLFLIVDLNGAKDTIRILSDLNRVFLDPTDTRYPGLREALGSRNAAIVSEARRLVEDGDAEAIGELMTEAQRHFDERVLPACPSELAAPALHRLLEDPDVRARSLGGKGVGSQGDGCAQFCVENPSTRDDLARFLRKKYGYATFNATIPAAE